MGLVLDFYTFSIFFCFRRSIILFVIERLFLSWVRVLCLPFKSVNAEAQLCYLFT